MKSNSIEKLNYDSYPLVVIFDLDGTLTNKDTYLSFLLYIIKYRSLRILRISILPFYVIFYFFKIIDNHKLKQIFLSAFLCGEKVENITALAYKFVDRLIKNGMNSTGWKMLHRHQIKGDRIILATASFDIYVKILANRLGIDEIICTEAEITDGKFTGRIDGLNCFGDEKLRRVKQYLGDIPMSSSIAYSDHISDFPMLEWAGKSYLITPTWKCLQDPRVKEFKILR